MSIHIKPFVKGKIELNNMKFYAYHGVHSFEREKGGWYSVSVTLETEIDEAAINDNLSGTINYEEIYRLVESEMKIPVSLIEHLAYKIVMHIGNSFPLLKNVMVCVDKHQPPVGGETEKARITIFLDDVRKKEIGQ